MKRSLIRIITLVIFIITILMISSCFVFCAGCATLSCASCSSCMSSCEDGHHGTRDDFPYVLFGSNLLENDNFILVSNLSNNGVHQSNCFFINKQTKDIFEVKYNDLYDSHNFKEFTYQFEFTENGFKQYAINRTPKYNVDTGKIDHYEYYKIMIEFDSKATEINRIQENELLAEEQALKMLDTQIFNTEDGFLIAEEYPSSDFNFENMPVAKKAIYDYGVSTTVITDEADNFYYTTIATKVINNKTYFSISYCNKHIFFSTREDFRGTYNSSYGYYDETEKQIKILHTVEDEEMIVFFNEKSIITLNTNNQIHIYHTENYEKKLVGTYENEKEITYIVPLDTGVLMYNNDYSETEYCYIKNFVFINDNGEVLIEKSVKETCK